MVMAVFLIPWFHFDRVNFSYLFYGSGRMDMIYIGIDMAESFPADEFFPIEISVIIPELNVPFIWEVSP
jgi:hypothetical protein|tara:strand:- start:301 stop:507 length:207 start_codon:yes stop_codon:yes gene_type:complete